MANIKVYKITCAVANTAYNVVTGTTAAATTPYAAVDKGRQIVFQNQTSGSVAKAGDSTVISTGGMKMVGDGAGLTYGPLTTSSSVQAGEWWVSSDTAAGVVLVHLVKHV